MSKCRNSECNNESSYAGYCKKCMKVIRQKSYDKLVFSDFNILSCEIIMKNGQLLKGHIDQNIEHGFIKCKRKTISLFRNLKNSNNIPTPYFADIDDKTILIKEIESIKLEMRQFNKINS